MLAALTAYINNDEAFFAEFAAKTPTAPRTLLFLAQGSLTPQITAQAEVLGAMLPQERTWTAGSCPICGGAPYLSRLLGKEGVRVCECSFCRASYRVPRLACPYCLEYSRGATSAGGFLRARTSRSVPPAITRAASSSSGHSSSRLVGLRTSMLTPGPPEGFGPHPARRPRF